jgi:hypothetical protein
MRQLPKAREMKSYDHLLPWNQNAGDLLMDQFEVSDSHILQCPAT